MRDRISRVGLVAAVLGAMLWVVSGLGCYEVYMNLGLLFGNNFAFKVDEIADHPDPSLLYQGSIPDQFYLPTDGPTYRVSFSSDGSTVTISGTPDPTVTGTRTDAAADPNTVQYFLNDGTFAGGRFAVWIEGETFKAEYSLYGSGLPVLKSERGSLRMTK